MKRIPTLLGILLLLPGLAASEPALSSTDPAFRSLRPADTPATILEEETPESWALSDSRQEDGAYFELSLSGSLWNTYNRGSLDRWFGEQCGDASKKTNECSTAYWQLGGAGYLVLGNQSYLLGIGADLLLPLSHSFRGSGNGAEVVLDSKIVSLSLPFKMEVADRSGVYLKIAPALLMGWVSGRYTSNSRSMDFVMTPGIGFGLSGGLDMLFSEYFGLALTAGFRVLQANLVYSDGSSSTGYSQPVLQSGDSVSVDMGGAYLTVGLLLHI